jgi:hypothetical protein
MRKLNKFPDLWGFLLLIYHFTRLFSERRLNEE